MERIVASAQEAPVQTNDGHTYELVSIVAYLIGVPKRIFENEHEPPKIDIYKKLDFNKNARIIRHLCIVRTSIERNYKWINDLMKTEYKSINLMPEYVPTESLQQLSDDGISFIKRSSTKLCHHVIEINRLISDRINNCKDLFPVWINWEYIKDIFIMPNGLTEPGTKVAADAYYSARKAYPYQVYINWMPTESQGNILYNDRRFAQALYIQHEDIFQEVSRVSDARDYVKDNIYDFVCAAEKVVLVVDCENSDPYKLCGTLRSLDQDLMQKISNILLFDDVNTAPTWSILQSYTQLPVEHIMIDRVKQNKSLVDIRLTARACQEHYQNNVDSFVIVSSDSDYWGLISSLPEARFLVMLEWEKCGPDIKAALVESGIYYCYLDNFYTGNTDDIKRDAILKEMYRYVENNARLNVKDMLQAALIKTRISMSADEQSRFYDRHIRQMTLNIDQDGNVTFEFKVK